jgi:hypothetical protein
VKPQHLARVKLPSSRQSGHVLLSCVCGFIGDFAPPENRVGNQDSGKFSKTAFHELRSSLRRSPAVENRLQRRIKDHCQSLSGLRMTLYSARNACMGFIEAERRAGLTEAASAIRKIRIKARTITGGSSGSTWNKNDRSNLVANTASTAPNPQPARPSLAPEAGMSRIPLVRREPRARQMAIFRVRSAAAKTITL